MCAGPQRGKKEKRLWVLTLVLKRSEKDWKRRKEPSCQYYYSRLPDNHTTFVIAMIRASSSKVHHGSTRLGFGLLLHLLGVVELQNL